MPLLPRRNNLDYNPNSIVNASKMIKNIALENMKNPVLDPDMKTLSAMDAEKNLKNNLEMMEQMFIDIESDLTKLSQFTGSNIARQFQAMVGSGMYGGAGSTKSDDSGYAGLSGLAGLFTQQKPRGRPKGSKNKPAPAPAPASKGSMLSFVTRTPSASTVFQRREQGLIRQPARFQPTLQPYATNSQAIPYGDPDDSDPDDDTASLPSSASNYNSRTNRSARSGSSIASSQIEDEAYNPFSVKTVISNLIIDINRKIQRLDFFFNSRIKPAYRKLTASQQEFLANFLKTIYGLYNNVFRSSKRGSYIEMGFGDLETFIINRVDNGDELLQNLKKSIDKLILDLSIGLNASKQFSTDGSTTVNTEDVDNYALKLAGFVGAGRKPRMTGCGRNFYGEKINNSRDIPTIRRSYQDCPTKYLL